MTTENYFNGLVTQPQQRNALLSWLMGLLVSPAGAAEARNNPYVQGGGPAGIPNAGAGGGFAPPHSLDARMRADDIARAARTRAYAEQRLAPAREYWSTFRPPSSAPFTTRSGRVLPQDEALLALSRWQREATKMRGSGGGF